MTTIGEWAVQFLDFAGLPVDDANVVGLVAWAWAEGSEAKFNPLDTTLRQPKATKYNTIHLEGGTEIHVWNYPSLEVGFQATLETLRNGHYQGVLNMLHTVPGDALGLARTVGHSPWGTGNFSRVVEDVLRDRHHHFARHLAGSPRGEDPPPAPPPLQPPPPPAPNQEDDDTMLYPDADTAIRCKIRELYRSYLHREVESEAVLAGWAAAWKDPERGPEMVTTSIIDSPEDQRYEAGEQEHFTPTPVA